MPECKGSKNSFLKFLYIYGPAWEGYVFLAIFIASCIFQFFPAPLVHIFHFLHITHPEFFLDTIATGGLFLGILGFIAFWIFFPGRFSQTLHGKSLYHYTSSIDAITKTRRILGRADGRVYAVSDPSNTNLGMLSSNRDKQVVVISAPKALEAFKPISGGRYTYDGWKMRRGEWRVDCAADIRIRKSRQKSVGQISGIEILTCEVLPHTGYLASLSRLRMWGRRVFLSSGLWLLYSSIAIYFSFQLKAEPLVWAPWIQRTKANWNFVWFIDLFIFPIVVFIISTALWFKLQSAVDNCIRKLEAERRSNARQLRRQAR